MDDIFKPISDHGYVQSQKALEYKIKTKADAILTMLVDFVIPHIGAAEIERHLEELEHSPLCFDEVKTIADINSEEEFLEWVDAFLKFYHFLNDNKLTRKVFNNPYKNHFDELVVRRDREQVSKR